MSVVVAIVGAGPCGCMLAHLLSESNKVIVIDKNESIGGCHRVHRDPTGGRFAEHGPRMYLDNYFVFRQVLKDIHLDFYETFTPFGASSLGLFQEGLNVLTFREILAMSWAFLTMQESFKTTTVHQFMDDHSFSPKSRDFIDRICCITDGAGSERYTMYNFMQLPNTKLAYGLFQPRLPNDESWLKSWKSWLETTRKVEFRLGKDVKSISPANQSVSLSDGSTVACDTIVLAIPPLNISQLISASGLPSTLFGGIDVHSFAQQTNYNSYIPIQFHWDTKTDLSSLRGDKWGKKTDWGIIYTIQSDYTHFQGDVVSANISRPNVKSNYTGHTANETPVAEDLAKEVFRQLSKGTNVVQFTAFIVSESVYSNNEWVPNDTAFVTTPAGYLPSTSESFPELFNCGTHNGNSNNSFTTLESALENAVELSRQLGIEYRKMNTAPLTTRKILGVVVVVVVLIYFLGRTKRG